MMGQLSGGQQRLVYSFNLEDHIPPQHLLRNIDQCLDLSDLRAHLRAAGCRETHFSNRIGRLLPVVTGSNRHKRSSRVALRISPLSAEVHQQHACYDLTHYFIESIPKPGYWLYSQA